MAKKLRTKSVKRQKPGSWQQLLASELQAYVALSSESRSDESLCTELQIALWLLKGICAASETKKSLRQKAQILVEIAACCQSYAVTLGYCAP